MHVHFKDAVKFIIKEQSKEILLVKTVVMIGMCAVVTLPPDTAMWVGLATNSIWLWRL